MSQENGERSGSAQERLFELWGEVVDLGSAMAVLQWDQETQMPPKGQESRGKQLATLAGIHHAKMTDPALADALDAAAPKSRGFPSRVREHPVPLAHRPKAKQRQIGRAHV